MAKTQENEKRVNVRYGFETMKIGDTIFMPTLNEYQDKVARNMANAANAASLRLTGNRGFIVTKMPGGVNCRCVHVKVAIVVNRRKKKKLIRQKGRVIFNGYWVTRAWYNRYGYLASGAK